MDQGLGAYTWWGFTPAVDLLENFGKSHSCEQLPKTLNIFLVGGSDMRHVLETLRNRYMIQEDTQLNFYILENHLEAYARAMLLLSITFELDQTMSLQEKTEMFLELYGNALIRNHTAQILTSRADKFIQMITDFDHLHEFFPMFDFESLKYKERDLLEGIFKFWRSSPTESFDVEKCWDLRVRQLLGTRYDASKGVFDWDYSMKLCERGAEIISGKLYQKWRKTGVAFELREGVYDISNRSLCSGMVFNLNGDRHARRGYWGDIVVSPYITYGVHCSDESFFRRANKDYLHNSEHVAQHNITSLIYELHHKKEYVAVQETPRAASESKLESVIEEIEEEEEIISSPEKTTPNGEEEITPAAQFLKPDKVKITFLPLSSIDKMVDKEKFQKLFDVVYFSNSMVHHLTPPVQKIFSDQCLLILESAKFITQLTNEQYTQFADKIEIMANNVGFKPVKPHDKMKDEHFYYKKASL